MREGRAKVGAVDRAVARGLGRVNVLAAAAVELDGFFVRDVRQADGQERLALAEHARASSEIGLSVLVQLVRGRQVTGSFLQVRDLTGRLGIEVGRTILASPRAVTIQRAWMSP